MSIGFKVVNRSLTSVFCAITNKTNPSGNAGWFEIQPNANTIWGRTGWEDVQFKNADNTKKKSLWINRGGPALVYFDGFDNDIIVYNEYKPEASFLVHNRSDSSVACWVSTNSGGNNNWFQIAPGGSETWRRSGWETVAFRTGDDKTRKGVYVNNRGTRATVDFYGFEKDIVVEHTTDSFLQDEHYAEAIMIADNSHYAQSSRASTEGGLTASIRKIDTLERIATGLICSNHILLLDLNIVYDQEKRRNSVITIRSIALHF
jgi:hypothetical protein